MARNRLFHVVVSAFIRSTAELRVSDDIAELVAEMFAKPLSAFNALEWNQKTMPALRRSLIRAIEQHVERRLLTVPLLETI
ncbi:MAG: hypothetical protein WDO18_06100 [Acidobacteriota bacterium]